MTQHDEPIEDLETNRADAVKGGVGAAVKMDGRTLASADATAQGASASAGDLSVAASAGQDGASVDTSSGNIDIDLG